MNIAIIGCGNMGKSLAQRLSKTNTLFLYDHHVEKVEDLAREVHCKACKDIKEAVLSSEMVILAVKPQSIEKAAHAIQHNLQKNQILVSILAGTPIKTLKHHFPVGHVVRMMPNLALIHGEGAIGLCTDEKIEKGQKDLLTTIFAPLGRVYWLPEEKMDAFTALTSSGPAFFFTLVEAMVDAGIVMGFSSKDAQEFVYQMIRGSLSLLEKTHKHPGELKWQIASPKGMTIRGLKKLEELGLRGGVINTFLAAYEAAQKLSP